MSKKVKKTKSSKVEKTISNRDAIAIDGKNEKLFTSPATMIIEEKKESKKTERSSLPVNDPNFLNSIEILARKKSYNEFENSLAENLKEVNQGFIINGLKKEAEYIKANNPLDKYKNTKEFKQAKSEFYFDVIYQVIELRIKIFEKVKEKYGENAASAFMFSMRDSMQDIWFNDKGNRIELEYKQKEIDDKEMALSKIQKDKEEAYENMPRVGYSNILDMSYETELMLEEKEDNKLASDENREKMMSDLGSRLDLPDLEGAKKVKPIRG